MKGQKARVGDERWSPNGYLYRRLPEKWELVHRIIAMDRLGRALKPNERVKFKDGNRRNLAPDNIVVYTAKEQSNGKKRAMIEAKIEQLQAMLEDL